MKTKPSVQKTEGVVMNLRKIREQMSLEIQDMTFEEQRAYLDGLLAGKTRAAEPNKESGKAA